jgi:hypothetical protein
MMPASTATKPKHSTIKIAIGIAFSYLAGMAEGQRSK